MRCTSSVVIPDVGAQRRNDDAGCFPAIAAAKVATALYRIYLGQDGDVLIILPGGGTKKGQNVDVQLAQQRWREYKSREKR